MCKYEMDPTSIAEDTERTWFCPQTDRQMDKMKPIYPPLNFVTMGGVTKARLGRATPLGQPKSVYKRDIECCLFEFWVQMAKWLWRSRTMTCFQYQLMCIWSKFDNSNLNPLQVIMRASQISKNSESKWTWRSRSMTPIFNNSRDYPKMYAWLKLVVPAQICDELSCGQVKFPKNMSQNDLEGQGQWLPFSIPAESI